MGGREGGRKEGRKEGREEGRREVKTSWLVSNVNRDDESTIRVKRLMTAIED